MIFSELYGSYYKAIAEIIKSCISEDKTASFSDIRPIIEEHAFSESIVAIDSAISEERWQVIKKDGSTAITHAPSTPLTILQKRWLKAISLDPRIRLFDVDFSFLGDVEPLFTEDDYYVFDKYDDGDNFEDSEYIKNFRLILDSIKVRQPLRIGILNRKGLVTNIVAIPEHLEYSEKDDKFRLITSGNRRATTVNLGRIVYCKRFNGNFLNMGTREHITARKVVFTVFNKRNALERVLLSFSHFEKEAEKIDDMHYRITINYDKEDETELIIRILSFGPMVQVIEPHRFVGLIKDRLIRQKSCGL